LAAPRSSTPGRHGIKEGLVERPQNWPGAHSVNALLTGEPLEGLWFDRTQEYAARRRGEDFDRLAYATVERLTLDPLPCWSGLPDDLYRQRIASLLAQIEETARAERERKGREPLGRAAILSQDPHDKPIRSKKSPAPHFHAFCKHVRQELHEAHSWFVAAFPRCLGEAAIRGSEGKVPIRKLSSRPPLRLVAPRISAPPDQSVSGGLPVTAESVCVGEIGSHLSVISRDSVSSDIERRRQGSQSRPWRNLGGVSLSDWLTSLTKRVEPIWFEALTKESATWTTTNMSKAPQNGPFGKT
jgi:hypothetical protein